MISSVALLFATSTTVTSALMISVLISFDPGVKSVIGLAEDSFKRRAKMLRKKTIFFTIENFLELMKLID